MHSTSNILTITAFWLVTLLPGVAEAQLQRERATTGEEPVTEIFPATSDNGLATVRNLTAGTLNTTVLHTFGLVTGGTHRLFGLDDGANTRLGLEYGITDRFSAGLSRMTFNKVIELQGKYNLLRQTRSDSSPVEIALKVAGSVDTRSGTGRSFNEKLGYFASVIAARKFGDLSLQISPMISHFNEVDAGDRNTLFGMAISANVQLNDRFSISSSYLPVLSERNPGTFNTFSMALNIETGGHLFQVFLSSSQWHNEGWIMANNRHRFLDGDFRFGFNIHRIFGLRRN